MCLTPLLRRLDYFLARTNQQIKTTSITLGITNKIRNSVNCHLMRQQTTTLVFHACTVREIFIVIDFKILGRPGTEIIFVRARKCTRNSFSDNSDDSKPNNFVALSTPTNFIHFSLPHLTLSIENEGFLGDPSSQSFEK